MNAAKQNIICFFVFKFSKNMLSFKPVQWVTVSVTGQANE